MIFNKIEILRQLRIQCNLVISFCALGIYASVQKSNFAEFVEKHRTPNGCRIGFVPESVNWSGDKPNWHLTAEFHLKNSERNSESEHGDIEVHFQPTEQNIVLEQIYLPVTMRRQGLLRWFTSLMVLYAREVLKYHPKRIDLEASSIRDSTFPPHIIYAKLGYRPDLTKLLVPIDSDDSHDTPGEFFLGPGPYSDETLNAFEQFLMNPKTITETGTENQQLVKRTQEFQAAMSKKSFGEIRAWAQLPMSLTLRTSESQWIEKQIVALKNQIEDPKRLFARLES